MSPPALLAPIAMPAQRGRATGQQGAQDFSVRRGQPGRGHAQAQAQNLGQARPRRLPRSAAAGHTDGSALRLGSRGAVPGPVQIQQLERTLHLGHSLPPHMQVGDRARKAAVAQELLHHGDLDARFEQMRGKGVPQTVNAPPSWADPPAPPHDQRWPDRCLRAGAAAGPVRKTARGQAEPFANKNAALAAAGAKATCNDPCVPCLPRRE